MSAATLLLRWLQRLEQTLTTAAFAVMVGVLGWDILGREVLSSGKIWATPIAVYMNVFIAFVGMGVASGGGAHLRPRFMDGLAPKRLDALFDRFTDIGFALFCAGAGVLCWQMLRETVQLAETDPVLQWPVWPFQAFLVAAFALGALRHSLYAAYPGLRPAPSGGENAPPTQQQVDEFAKPGEATR